ncbi:MAG: helical backbone metal receptor [Bacteroidia bacterium]|nr:helical backbone metal receptor [Bacteroidia bacterium]
MPVIETKDILKAANGRIFKRIVSLVPSFSCTLYEMSEGLLPVGITKFCNRPEMMFRTVPRVGGTKNIHVDKILSLSPDLVLTSREENIREQVEALAQHTNVWLTDIKTIPEMMEWLEKTITITGYEGKGREIYKNLEFTLNKIKNKLAGKTVVYFIWKEPWMSVGCDTFIHAILEHLGMKNLFGGHTRYPSATPEEVKQLKPDYIFLSSEPYPFKPKDAEEWQPFFNDSKVMYVQGEIFSWYGSALLDWNKVDFEKF